MGLEGVYVELGSLFLSLPAPSYTPYVRNPVTPGDTLHTLAHGVNKYILPFSPTWRGC